MAYADNEQRTHTFPYPTPRIALFVGLFVGSSVGDKISDAPGVLDAA